MDKLERALEKVELEREEVMPSVKEPLYQGFRLIEEKVYGGGTGIVYWM